MTPSDDTVRFAKLSELEAAISPYRDLRLALQPFAVLFDSLDDAIRDVGMHPRRFVAEVRSALRAFDVGRPNKLGDLERALRQLRDAID